MQMFDEKFKTTTFFCRQYYISSTMLILHLFSKEDDKSIADNSRDKHQEFYILIVYFKALS